MNLNENPLRTKVYTEQERNETINKVEGRLKLAIMEKVVKYFDFRDSLIGKLTQKYGQREAHKCALYNWLLGGTGLENLEEFLDFPGDDSIQKAVEELQIPNEKTEI